MNEKLEKLLPSIENELLNDAIGSFKIGKTDNPEQRFEQQDYDQYDFADVIAISDDVVKISQAENDLINYFTMHDRLRTKCKNQRSGSAGNEDCSAIYIVSALKSRDVHDGVLPKQNLFDESLKCEL